MALTASARYTTHGPDSYGRFAVANAVTIHKGALVAYTIGTGTVTNYDDVPNALLLGYALEQVTGNAGLTNLIQVQLRGDILRDQAVVGVSSRTTNGQEVYATDENTFTLTRPVDDAVPIGIVLDGDATDADVFLFSVKESAVLSLAGGSKHSIHLGTINTSALEGVLASDLRAGIVMWGHGVITACYSYPVGFDAGYVAGSQLVNLELGGVNVTGGVLTLAFGNIDGLGDVGTRINATPVTAANEFHDGDLLDVELAAAGTGFTAVADTQGFDLFIDVEYRAGA